MEGEYQGQLEPYAEQAKKGHGYQPQRKASREGGEQHYPRPVPLEGKQISISQE